MTDSIVWSPGTLELVVSLATSPSSVTYIGIAGDPMWDSGRRPFRPIADDL